jgi:hypothetical protein
MRRVFVLTCLAICLLPGCEAVRKPQRLVAVEPEEYVRANTLLMQAQAHMALVESGTGSGQLRFARDDDLDGEWDLEIDARVAFAFKGEWLRSDTILNKPEEIHRTPWQRKNAFSEDRYFSAFYREGENRPYEAHSGSGKGPVSRTGVWSLIPLNYRRIEEPWMFSLEEFISGLDDGAMKLRSMTSDGRYHTMQILANSDEHTYHELVLDSESGYAITNERYIENDRLVNEIRRTYGSAEGVWVLESLIVQHWGGVHVGRPIRETIFQVSEFSANADVPDRMFDFRGFDLPPGTIVYDQDTGEMHRTD